MAELLLALRLELLPVAVLDKSSVGRARYDIRGISELLVQLALVPQPNMETLKEKVEAKNGFKNYDEGKTD